VPKPEQGRIILVEVMDPQKRNSKTRPAVSISENKQIKEDGRIICVAVTSAVPDKLPGDFVLLPFHPGGKSRTGLRKRSAAMCSWLFEVREDQIERYLGIVPSAKLQEILNLAEGDEDDESSSA
jgi:mRNA-degrading endonuclease toxin of MazEF toxin-antitoxin module